MSQEEDYNKKKNQIANGLLCILAVCVISVGLIGWLVASKLGYELPQDVNEWGIIGDFVGGLSNPLISTFTFFALLLTIIQNQKVIGINEAELRETRKEIELTREANEAQAIEFKAQNDLLKKQAELDLIMQALIRQSDVITGVWDSRQTKINLSGMKVSIKELIREGGDSSESFNTYALEKDFPGASKAIVSFSKQIGTFARLAIEYTDKVDNGALLTSILSVVAEPIVEVLQRGYLKSLMSEEELQSLSYILTERAFI